MREKLSDATIKKLPSPPSGQVLHFDSEVSGFGIRLTVEAKSFFLNYRTRGGRERRYTIGPFSVTGQGWTTTTARRKAEELKASIRLGADPMGDLSDERKAETVGGLATRFREEHLGRKRPATVTNYEILLERFILPELRAMKVRDVKFADIDALHRKVTKAGRPYQANRAMAVLSKMFSLAVKWELCTANPAKGVERNPEERRQRYLAPAEVETLGTALTTSEDKQGANIIRLLLLTGARSGEVMGMEWAHLDLGAGKWTKPSSHTKQKREHSVPLSAPARQLLAAILESAKTTAKAKDKELSPYVFPGRIGGHRADIKKTWAATCKAAGIVEKREVRSRAGKVRVILMPSARIHDLRHTYASLLASSGLSLPIIGALLGHTQPSTTARYAHLMDDPLRAATERVGAIVSRKPKAKVMEFARVR